eukprot:48199-Rhodomonas_salina.1
MGSRAASGPPVLPPQPTDAGGVPEQRRSWQPPDSAAVTGRCAAAGAGMRVSKQALRPRLRMQWGSIA